LRCRQDERIAARNRRIKKGARFGMLALAGGIVVLILALGLTAVVRDARSRSVAAAGEIAPNPPSKSGKSARPKRNVAASPSTEAVIPRIAEGRKDLGDGVFAERNGDEVIVNFDTETLRTRFDWKFEGIVRTTLPQVYGQEVGTALDSIPTGKFVYGDVLTQLPTRGVALSLPRSRTLRVWPITRPGRDGPIIVAYRAK
jgi:hypothetical protein